jgi:hypothetical protein
MTARKGEGSRIRDSRDKIKDGRQFENVKILHVLYHTTK